ncbi:MAG: hypothetical protein ACYDCG_19085 [Candidatus Acidiferrales bacterium]
MKILPRIGATIFALALLSGVVYLGVLSGRDSKFVVWFGIAAAIVAPLGIGLLSYSLTRSKYEVIERLAQVPEIERLVAEAKTQEEKVRVLQNEAKRMAEVVQLESRRQAARDRIESLERDGLRIVHELDGLDKVIRLIDNSVGDSIISEEINRLRERVRSRERGDLVLRLGTREYRIDHDIIKAMPFGIYRTILVYFRLLEKFREYRQRSSGIRTHPTDEPPNPAHLRGRST